MYDWAWVPLDTAAPVGWMHALLARRSRSAPDEIASYRVFAPVDTSLDEVVRAAGSRWSIEEGFERAKTDVGLDQYEVRTWTAWHWWHRHVTLGLLAQAYLDVTRLTATRAAGTSGAGKKGALPPT